MNNHIPSVRDLILERKRAGSVPGSRNDPHRLALAIEGGGMRGVVSAGMVGALEHLGLRDTFDAVYGCSAGAICGAYFVSGQARYGTTIFYEDINNNDFINLRRAASGQPILSLSFLLDYICRSVKILNVRNVLTSNVPLVIIGTAVDSAESTSFRDFTTEEALYDALRASATIPVVAGPPVAVGGRKYLDGALTEAIPYQTAMRDGYTHVLALLTRPYGVFRNKPGFIDRAVIGKILRRQGNKIADCYLRRDVTYAEEVAELRQLEKSAEGFQVLAIQKDSGVAIVGSMEKDRKSLVAGAMGGYASVYQALFHESPELIEIITPTLDVTNAAAKLEAAASPAYVSHHRKIV